MFSILKKTTLILSALALLSTTAMADTTTTTTAPILDGTTTFTPSIHVGDAITASTTVHPDFGVVGTTCTMTDTITLGTNDTVTTTGTNCVSHGGAVSGTANIGGTEGSVADYSLDVSTTQPTAGAATFSIPMCKWGAAAAVACGTTQKGTVGAGGTVLKVGAKATVDGEFANGNDNFAGSTWTLTVAHE